MRRKGQYDLGHNLIYFMGVAFMLAFVFGFSLNFVGEKYYDVYKMNSRLEDSFLISKILSRCFEYIDKSGRSYVGIIDLEKFNDENLERCAGKNVMVSLEGDFGSRVAGKKVGGAKIVREEIVRFNDFKNGRVKIEIF